MQLNQENTQILPITIKILENLQLISRKKMEEILINENYLCENEEIEDFRFVTIKTGKDCNFAVYDLELNTGKTDTINLPFDLETGQIIKYSEIKRKEEEQK